MLEDERKVKKEQIIEYLRRFPFYKWAASFVAINQDTLKDWRTEDKDFSDRVETARSEGMRFYGGKATPDLILKSADPQTFKEQKEVTLNVTNQLSDEQLNQLIQSKIGQVGIANIASGEGEKNEAQSSEVCNPTSEAA